MFCVRIIDGDMVRVKADRGAPWSWVDGTEKGSVRGGEQVSTPGSRGSGLIAAKVSVDGPHAA